MRYGFQDRFSFSMGTPTERDMAILKQLITGCVGVEKTDPSTDRLGVDYIVTLRRGAQIYVDGKTREKGASKYWKYGEPEVALEKWSVVPESGSQGKVGWTLNEASPVNKILFTFDPSDSDMFFLMDFQNLRMAFAKYCNEWDKKYGITTQTTDGWESQTSKRWHSQAVFVPVSVVDRAMKEFTQGYTSAFVCGHARRRLMGGHRIRLIKARRQE